MFHAWTKWMMRDSVWRLELRHLGRESFVLPINNGIRPRFLSLHLLFQNDSFWVWLDWSHIISDYINWLLLFWILNFIPFFQILYAGEGESRKPDEGVSPSFDDSVGSTASLASSTGGARTASFFIKGHEFVQVKIKLRLGWLEMLN
jgi:hypothetical protein